MWYGGRLDELVHVGVELLDQVVDGDRLAGLDAAMQGLALVGHQVRHVDVEEPAPEAGVAVPRLRPARPGR